MSILMVYHTLEERDTNTISPMWKYSVVILLGIAIFEGCFCSYSFYSFQKGLEGQNEAEANYDEWNCFLWATVGENTLLNMTYLVWGQTDDCNFAVYCPVVQAMSATVWLTLFLMFGRGGASISGFNRNPWCIVLPATIYMILMVILSCIYVGFVHSGLNAFCREYVAATWKEDLGCLEILDLLSQGFPSKNSELYQLLPISGHIISIYISMYLQSTVYVLMLLVMLLRCLCFVDFQLVRVTITSVSRRNEVVKEMTATQSSLKRVNVGSIVHKIIDETTDAAISSASLKSKDE